MVPKREMSKNLEKIVEALKEIFPEIKKVVEKYEYPLATIGLYVSYKAEEELGKRKLKDFNWYVKRLEGVAKRLKRNMKKGKSADDVIREFLFGLEYEKEAGAYPTYSLESNKSNCISSTFLFLALGEILDKELYSNLSILELPGHVVARKATGENIDLGEVMQDDFYKAEGNKVIEEKPKENIVVVMLYSYGGMLWKQNKREGAKKYVEKAIEIDPKCINAHYLKGSMLIELKSYEEAVEELEIVLKLDSKHVDARYLKGVALTEMKKYKKALVELEKVIEMDPNHIDAWYSKYVLLKRLGKQKEAKKCYRMYKKLKKEKEEREAILKLLFGSS